MARKILASFKAVVKDAKRRGLVAQNVAADATIGANGRHKRRLEVGVDIPTPSEVKALLAAADPKARALICLAALAGLRASELRGLRWSDLELGLSLRSRWRSGRTRAPGSARPSRRRRGARCRSARPRRGL